MNATATAARPTIGEPVPGYHSLILAPVVRLDSWGAYAVGLDPIDPRDAAAEGWSATPEWRMQSPAVVPWAVRVQATGRAVRRMAGAYWLRARVEFCGDGQPSHVSPGWILCR